MVGNIKSMTSEKSNITEDVIKNMLISQGTNMSQEQLSALKQTLELTLSKYNIKEDYAKSELIDIQEHNAKILRDYINAKKIEGRSNSTLYGYAKELSKMFLCLNKPVYEITSSDIRDYIAYRKNVNGVSSVTIANIRLYLMSFFKWCMAEEFVRKNPMDRIGVIKTEQRVLEVLNDEEAEIIRCACKSERDLAIIDLLSGSGMRVSELVGLNKSDVNFETGEVLVFGKGAKERVCFLTGKAKVHLKWYLDSRDDDNEALFVTAKEPHNRISKNGIEYILRTIAKSSKIPKTRLYPHKYRSTLATNMINKGAEASMVQGILGHSNVNTTLKCYCKVDKESYKRAHKQFS